MPSAAWLVFPLGLKKKIEFTLDYQSEGRILLPWVLWKSVFKRLQMKVRELRKQVLKRQRRKCVGLPEIDYYGLCHFELFTTFNSMVLTQLKFFVRRSLVSSRTEIWF